MFYSQFILAKKGPLGTIWIAAHLERKLRKNQVADTDIGLSVDSILFPEEPIALRLSSHLLLGVVRIYSKKVNYLFHDCSEALVKIKQAFRSTVVDLPPDESTAPYHSITLPETFDLDNFELPESALLSSNFVDHHVSTKEQITLQDTGNRTSLQTSMFGLDERFGDDDTSLIGLELEQELFMDKRFSPLHASFSVGSKEGVLHGEHSLLTTSLGNGGHLSYNKGNYSESPNALSELLCNNHDREGFSCLESLRRNEDTSHRHSYSIQTPDLNEVFIPDCQMAPSPYIALTPEEVQTPCLIEPAQGPSTPGLLEEVMPSNFQEIPALSPQERVATPAEPGRPWRSSGSFMEVEYAETGNETGHTDTSAIDHSLGGTAEGLSSSAVFEQRSGSLAQTYLDENVTTHNSCLPSDSENTIVKSAGNEMNDVSVSDQMLDNRVVILPSAISDETGYLDSHIKLATLSGAEPISSNFSTDNVNKVDFSGANWDAKATAHNFTEPSNTSTLGHTEDIGSCLSGNTSGFHLSPCTSNLHLDVTLEGISELSHREQFCSLEIPIREEGPHICESSREVQGEDLHSTNFGDSNQEQKQKPVCMFSCVKSGVIEPHELSTCDLSKVIQPDHFHYSTSSEFREPEKMLAPACIVDFPNDRGQETAEKGLSESDVSVDRISSLYSKKRQLMDSTVVQQTGTAAKLSGVPRSWRNAVPDDDDLLASILVGRKSQLLKIGTLLPPSTASSHKRPRTMSKVGMLKRRKVLVDDTMFLHADIIRQQLTNTEDIRRIRKKAPCTRPDIWRIHIYEAEDDIFKNCVLTGVIPELNSLECQRYNLHENLSAQVKNHNSHSKTSEEADSCRTSQFVNEVGSEVLGGSVLTLPSLDHVEDKTPLVINGVDIEQAHEDVKHLVVKEQLEPMLVHSQMEPLKGPNSTEMDAVVSLDHVGDNDPLVVSVAEMEQAHENVKQLVVKDQIEQISVRPQMEPLIDDPISFMSDNGTFAMSDSQLTMTETYITENVETCPPPEKHDNEIINNLMISEMEADPHGGFHLMMTETYIVENAETCLPFEKPDEGSTVVMEQPLPPEGQDRQNTLLDDLEHVTKETTNNSAVVFMDSECLIHAEEESNAVGTSSKDKEKHANEDECMASLSAHTEQISSAVEENSVVQEYNLDDGLHMYANPIDVAVARDSSDFYGAMDDNCAELLNVDDEADLDVAENDAPDSEAAKLLENSGWSVRTRGVAKYLKNLFYEESVHGRRTVAVDRLLSGKTRKEASRMFFEILVLKSMDYIQVQQETPFSHVHIKPTMKLQESEF